MNLFNLDEIKDGIGDDDRALMDDLKITKDSVCNAKISMIKDLMLSLYTKQAGPTNEVLPFVGFLYSYLYISYLPSPFYPIRFKLSHASRAPPIVY